MTPEEFRRTYEDTHTELQALELMRNNGSLIKTEPGARNITVNGKIPGKALIEKRAMEERAEGLAHCLMDAVGARVGDLMDIPMDKLVSLAIKANPQKIDQTIDHSFTFADMVKKASLEVENYETIETADHEEQPEV